MKIRFYSRHETQTPRRWYHRWGVLPHFMHGDISTENVLVWGVWFIGHVGLVQGDCHCAKCVDLRQYRHLESIYGKDLADDVRAHRLRVQQMQGNRTPRV